MFLGSGTGIQYKNKECNPDIIIYTKPHYYSIKDKVEVEIGDPLRYGYCYGLTFNEDVGFNVIVFHSPELKEWIYCEIELKYGVMRNKATDEEEMFSLEESRQIMIDNKEMFDDKSMKNAHRLYPWED